MRTYEIIENYEVPAMDSNGKTSTTVVWNKDKTVGIPVSYMVKETILLYRNTRTHQSFGVLHGPDGLYHIFCFKYDNPDNGFKHYLGRFYTYEKVFEYGWLESPLPICESHSFRDPEQSLGSIDVLRHPYFQKY